jgi:hypothetical protein
MPKSPDRDGQPRPTLDLDALMQRLRAEVNARKSHSSAEPASAPDHSKATAAPRGCTADTLLSLPDAEFVRAAYAAIFAREAIETEFAKSRDRLLTGEIGRTRLLRELLRSDEAVKRGARIEGLGRRELSEWIRRSAPAKWAMNVAHTVRTIYLLPRRIRQFLKRVDGIERTAGETALRTNQLLPLIHSLEESVSQAAAKIALLEQEHAMLKSAFEQATADAKPSMSLRVAQQTFQEIRQDHAQKPADASGR